MSAVFEDQAAGLRRLFAPPPCRIVGLVAARPGVGLTTCLRALAVSLAERGRRVLSIEAPERRPTPPGPWAALPQGLEAVIAGRRRLSEVVADGPAGIQRLLLDVPASHLALLSAPAQQALSEAFADLGGRYDAVLVSAAQGERIETLAPALAAQQIVVLLDARAASITAAYAAMKQMAQHYGQRRFHLLLNRTRGDGEAEVICNNIALAAGRFLKLRPDVLGVVPEDAKARQAHRLGRSVLETFPDAPAGRACRNLAETIESWPAGEPGEARLSGFLNRLAMTARLLAEGARI